MKKILTLIFSLLLILSLVGCSEEGSTSSTESTDSAEEVTEDVIIYEDEIFKATSLGFTENAGYWMVVVKLENKTDSKISIYPMDSSVDNETVTFTSGVPATIKAGKEFTQSWIINNEPKEKAEFTLKVYDDDMNEIETTDMLTVEK